MFLKNFKPFFSPEKVEDASPDVEEETSGLDPSSDANPGESGTDETPSTDEIVTKSMEPRSRSEKMYAKIAGNPSFQNFAARSRKEHFLDDIAKKEGPGGDSPMIAITYQELVALRNASQLIPGMQYRITDYVCTVANDAEAQAVSHPYDIIVTADDASTLNENARACLHDGDIYYSTQGAQADLTAWELKYCLDNDTDRFAWADSTNGKGVVFWLKDDWNNECHYDFKQIQFKRYKITACTKSPDLVDTYLAASEVSGDITADLTDFIWAYTFSGVLDESIIDTSVYNWVYHGREGYCHCYDNAIKTFAAVSGAIGLNNIVFLASDVPCRFNTFGNNCGPNTFGNNCGPNTFGNNCGSNTFGNNCRFNTFGNECGSNTFGNNCGSNTFGNNCGSNTFGNNCRFNTFGNDAQGNEASAYCRWCTFEDGVKGVVLSNDTATNVNQIQNYYVLNGTQGVMKTGWVFGNPVQTPITINASLGLSYCTYVGKNSSGVVKTWAPADLVQS